MPICIQLILEFSNGKCVCDMRVFKQPHAYYAHAANYNSGHFLDNSRAQKKNTFIDKQGEKTTHSKDERSKVLKGA